MPNETLKLKNIGPIAEAAVRFGDLTILVGPPATGKSIFFQFLKLLLDAKPIVGFLAEHGLNWHRDIKSFLELYVGANRRRLEARSKRDILARFFRGS